MAGERPKDALGAAPAAGLAVRKTSIARRLFLSSAILSFSILFIVGAGLSTVYQHSAERNFDDRLGVYLQALVSDIATGGDGGVGSNPDELSDPHFGLPLSGWYWQITRLGAEKAWIRASRSLFAARLPRLATLGVKPGMGGARRGYVKGPDGRRLRLLERVIDAGDEGVYLVQVAATTEDVETAITHFDLDLVIAFGVLAAALVASSALQLRYGLAPLRQLQEGVAAIRRGEADALSGSFSPDLAPLAAELNLLIAANRDVVERARTHVGNLAHALKTPLSVIINEAALKPGPLADKVDEQASVMRDQIAYYLDRARAAVRAGAASGTTEVGPVISSFINAFEKIFAERAIAFTLDMPQRIRFLGERQDLEEMVGNLIDNAGKWAKSAVAITVSAEAAEAGAERAFFEVVIDDDGPGLAEHQRTAALARGRRLDETKPGSGLGLSIVVDLAGLYGGRLTLDRSPAGGLRAVLLLPAAAPVKA